MKRLDLAAFAIRVVIAPPIAASAQSAAEKQTSSTSEIRAVSQDLLKAMVGSWQCTCRTWFEPGKLADESKLSGTIRPVLEGRFLRHEYVGTIQGRPRHGDETIAFNSVTKKGRDISGSLCRAAVRRLDALRFLPVRRRATTEVLQIERPAPE